MQIKKLIVDNYKCLVDFKIDFSTNTSGSSTILIGENGIGKTTTLEVILRILMSFDSPTIEKNINFSYEIEYYFGGELICINQSQKYYTIDINHQNICMGKMNTIRNCLAEERKTIFPQRIIVFYSGANDKFKDMIKQINSNYAKDCRNVINKFLKSMSDDTSTIITSLHKRKFNYCDESLTPIYLSSILGGNDTFEKRYLKEKCGFDSILYIDMIINVDKVEHFFGRERFEGDIPTGLYYLTDYLDYRFTDIVRRGFMYSSIGKAYFEIDCLEELGVDTISILEFFEKLHTLFDAQYEVTISKGEDEVKCSDMSEGQRQLIKMLGMLGVCKREDCLVLMDEPDAHMNPIWKYEIKNTIDESLKTATNSQALIATHDPLVINGVNKEFIRIFAFNEFIKRENGYHITKIIEPTEDTQGMGIDGLLQSEYYGLKTSYDKSTSEKFIKRQALYNKLINSEIDDEGKKELRNLTKELGSLPVSYNSLDFLYDDFIRVFKNTEYYSKEYLSYEDIRNRRRKIEEIVQALYEGQV